MMLSSVRKGLATSLDHHTSHSFAAACSSSKATSSAKRLPPARNHHTSWLVQSKRFVQTETIASPPQIPKEGQPLVPEDASSAAQNPSPSSSSTPPEPPAHTNNRSRMSPSDLLKPKFPDTPPQISDLARLRPTKFFVPVANSKPSQRIVYANVWKTAAEILGHSFSKNQLVDLLGPKGLQIDPLDPETKDELKELMRRAKAKKQWAPKRLTDFSKDELVRLIMVKEWKMVDPALLPGKDMKQVKTVVPITEKQFFLILAPYSLVLKKFAKVLAVKYSFNRDLDSSQIYVTLQGNEQAVMNAKQLLADVEKTASRRVIELPGVVETLESSVYREISRLTQVYIEPASELTRLSLSSVSKASIMQAQNLIRGAFLLRSQQAQIPLFVDSSESDVITGASTSTLLALTPTTSTYQLPYTRPSPTFPLSNFRLQRVSNSQDVRLDIPAETSPHLESAKQYLSWSLEQELSEGEGKTKGNPWSIFDPVAGPGVSNGDTSPEKSTEPWAGRSVVDALGQSWQAENAGEAGTPLNLKATFGQFLWTSRDAVPKPVDLKSLTSSGQTIEGAKQGFFTHTSPANFFDQTGVLHSPVEAWQPGWTDESERLPEVIDNISTFSSKSLRRITFMSTSDPLEEMVVEVEFAGHDMKGKKEEVFRSLNKVKRSVVNVAVPNGGSDTQLSLTQSCPVDFGELGHGLRKKEFISGALTLTLLSDPLKYILKSDHFVRQTIISPPLKSMGSPPSRLTFIQEHWTDIQDEDQRGTTIEADLGTFLVGRKRSELADEWASVWKRVGDVCRQEWAPMLPRRLDSLE
ncbi:hypothetical protein T439DRAFT_383987 [Meredithblackwellia eburnea MCA 4105]